MAEQAATQGERDNAAALLAKLCKLHKVTPEELADDAQNLYPIAHAGLADLILVSNVIAAVCGTSAIRCYRSGPKVKTYELTAAQFVDVREALKHYRRDWARNSERAMRAFCYQHKITPPEREKTAGETAEEREEAERIRHIMRGMTGSHWKKGVALPERAEQETKQTQS